MLLFQVEMNAKARQDLVKDVKRQIADDPVLAAWVNETLAKTAQPEAKLWKLLCHRSAFSDRYGTFGQRGILNAGVDQALDLFWKTPCKSTEEFEVRLKMLGLAEAKIREIKSCDAEQLGKNHPDILVWEGKRDRLVEIARREIKNLESFTGGFLYEGRIGDFLGKIADNLPPGSPLEPILAGAVAKDKRNVAFADDNTRTARAMKKITFQATPEYVAESRLSKELADRILAASHSVATMSEVDEAHVDWTISLFAGKLCKMAGIAAEEKFLKATGSMTGFGQRYGDFDETLGRMIDLMKKMPDRVLYHFVRTATQEQYVLADDFEKICSAYPNGMENAPMIVALSSCAGVENQGTVKGKVGEIGKRAAVLRQLGLEYVERYDPVILENVYLTAIGKAPKLDRNGKGTKLAILLSNKSDWNQVFETNADDCRSLIANGYNLIICECKTDKEVVERFFNYGRLKENAGNNAHFQQGMKDHARYDFAVFMAHGTPFVLDYGTDSWWKALNHFYSGDYTLGVRDELMLKLAGDWEGMFTKKAKIGVDACLAGLDMVIIGNFIEMISRVTGQETIGSNRSTNLKKYEFDRDGYVTNMLFYKGKTATAFPK